MVKQQQKNRADVHVRKPHFFKVLLGDFSQRLKIPVRFMKHISMKSLEKVVLRGPSGSRWPVKLSRTGKGTFLSDGWMNFVKTHALREYEFLVFRYNGRTLFDVLVFDITACEREDLFNIRRRKRLRKHKLEVLSLPQPEVIKTELKETQIQDVVYPVTMIKDACPDSVQGESLVNSETDKHVEIKVEVTEIPIVAASPKKCLKTQGYLSRRRPVSDEERSKAWEAANSFMSNFPYTVVCLSALHVYKASPTLTLPTPFSREHLPRRRTNLVFRDPNGQAWVIMFIPGMRNWLSGGWPAFARGNNLEEGDICVFELVGPIEFHVHIFRVVDETVPMIKLSSI
ncbi:B3 DNA binding domain-containing protein [Dioscorea alata]|uniref:B3 DNA binding domain-containing protein n=1 Tax=Dioscorea alata TaxID=55571 RepID=A0ACB7TS74_DIOAL|nr:B3 DNA binding domain-containing protein [Dioscorea alata]